MTVYERIRTMIAQACQRHIDAGVEAEIMLAHSMRVDALLRTRPRPGDVRVFDDSEGLVVGVTRDSVWLADGRGVRHITAYA